MKTSILVLLSATFSGCATIYDGKYDYDEGWRIAEILYVGSSTADFPEASLDCRNITSQQSGAVAYYGYVRYLRNFAPRHAIVPIPESFRWTGRKRLYLNIATCLIAL